MRSQSRDKGVAGLVILLSLVTMLFIIGLLVMIFTLMGGSLQDVSYTDLSATNSNETLTTVAETGENFAVSTYRSVSCTISIVTNATNGAVISSGNYTQTNCNLASSGTGVFNNTNWNVTYSYTYEGDTTATEVLNDTTIALSSTTNFFTIFIVIASMVVLVLLTVIIIVAVRGSGLMSGSAKVSGGRGIGTA